MALVKWEIESEDTEADIQSTDSPKEQALKHAYAISEMYFENHTWTFTIELDDGRVFLVDLETDSVTEIEDDDEDFQNEDDDD